MKALVNLFRRQLKVIAYLSAVCSSLGNTIDIETVQENLDGPVQLELANGNLQNGRIKHWDGELLRIEVNLDGGSVAATYRAEEVDTIQFAGDEYLNLLVEHLGSERNHTESLLLFRALYKQRGPYLEFLSFEELQLFVKYAQFALKHDQPLITIAIIEVLRPHINDPMIHKSLDDAELLGTFLGGMIGDARELAHAWIEEAPQAGSSALGWRVLAELHFQEGHYEDAFWTALYPIAFANRTEVAHLDLCYAFAITAAKQTRQDEVAISLFNEMEVLGIEWPQTNPTVGTLKPIRSDSEDEPQSDSLSPEETDTLTQVDTQPITDPIQSLPTRIK